MHPKYPEPTLQEIILLFDPADPQFFLPILFIMIALIASEKN
jgi:hypothetical protein